MNVRLLFGPSFALLLMASAASCSSTQAHPGAEEELMFALPHWCGREGKRQRWDEWAIARDRAPTGTGVCGVRVDVAGLGDTTKGEAGLCVALEKGALAKLEMRQAGSTLLAEQVVGMQAEREPATVRTRIDVLGQTSREADVKFRIENSSITAVAPDGTRTTGPCFWQ